MDNFDYDYLLNGFVIVAEAIDRANALKAIELRLTHEKIDVDYDKFLSKLIDKGEVHRK